MSVLFSRSLDLPTVMSSFGLSGKGSRVTAKRAMRHSVVWSATRLRADLVSLMPIDVFRRRSGGPSLEVAAPPVLAYPCEVAEGHPMPIGEWMYATQSSLDRTGNLVGIIHGYDKMGKPSIIEPVDPDKLSFTVKGSRITQYRISGEHVKSEHIWHERQYTAAGIPVGLSPITHAALQLAAGLSAQEFAVEWFENGGVPKAILRNAEKTITPDVAAKAKTQFKESISNGDIFTVGKDWQYEPISAKAAEASFIEQMQYTDADLCRFMGVPADMVDVSTGAGGSITYANITQRNLQLLVMNLGGAVKRREDALSRLTPAGQFVKLNRSAVLAMDDKTRAELFKTRIDSRTMTPDQVRALEDEMPLTETDYAQFDRLFGARTPNQPQTAGS